MLLGGRGGGLHELQLAPEYQKLGSNDRFFRDLDDSHGLIDGGQTLVHLANTQARLGQQPEQVGPHQSYADGRETLQPRAHMADAFPTLALCSQRPATQDLA
jgi:hypothetical protein